MRVWRGVERAANRLDIHRSLQVRDTQRTRGPLRSSAGFAPMCSTLPCHFSPR
jgi:hypothetical protein